MLGLIYEQIRTGVLGGGYVQIDKPPIRYLVPGNGQTKQGYLWTIHRPGGDVVYRWETTRAASCLDNIVPIDFTGTSSATATPVTELMAIAALARSP
jgi:hypothetical protein